MCNSVLFDYFCDVLSEHTYICTINGSNPMHSCLYVKLVSGAGVFTV
jgi:hypothetical protein